MAFKISPKTFKYGRVFRIKLKQDKFNSTGYKFVYLQYGIKSLENAKITIEHLNAISRFVKRYFKKEINVKYNTSLLIPVTSKPVEARLGCGKGSRSHWECVVRKGMIVIEFGGFIYNYDRFILVLKAVQNKLPFFSKIVRRSY